MTHGGGGDRLLGPARGVRVRGPQGHQIYSGHDPGPGPHALGARILRLVVKRGK